MNHTTRMILAVSAGMMFREGEPGSDGAGTPAPAKTTRKIKMNDGREVEFSEKGRMQKESYVEGDSMICRIDFDNSETVQIGLPLGNLLDLAKEDTPDGRKAKMSIEAIGHGLKQKLGDAAAGAKSTKDALEDVISTAKQVAAGDWNKAREGGGGGGSSSELVEACVVVLGKNLETVRTVLATLEPKEKTQLRRSPAIAAEIEKIRAAQKPTDADKAKEEAANKLLEGLRAAVA